MDRIEVISRSLKSVGYFNEVLEIEFQSGEIYRYFDVGPEVFGELLQASSKGKYFHRYIKEVYDCEKI